jgi:hypothetical protein
MGRWLDWIPVVSTVDQFAARVTHLKKMAKEAGHTGVAW